MNLGTQTQQPSELLDYDIDYSKWLVGTDGIASFSVDVVPPYDAVNNPDGLKVTYLTNTDTTIKFWAKGGVSGTTYKATITVETADGRIKQDEIKFKIKEI
jgi:hypothetical protein